MMLLIYHHHVTSSSGCTAVWETFFYLYLSWSGLHLQSYFQALAVCLNKKQSFLPGFNQRLKATFQHTGQHCSAPLFCFASYGRLRQAGKPNATSPIGLQTIISKQQSLVIRPSPSCFFGTSQTWSYINKTVGLERISWLNPKEKLEDTLW